MKKNEIVDELMKEISHPFFAFRFSLEGLLAAIKKERAFRHELLIGVVHLVAVLYFEMSLSYRLLLVFAWFVLLAVELLNSAIEAVVDLISPEWHELSKRAKDCGSAAVLMILIAGVIGWAIVLIPKVMRLVDR